MKIAAIISEYNPFHNGHKYLIEKARNELHVDKILVIMSGDFTQRGEPGILSKEIRTRLALTNGADLVLQLPIPYATGSADLFAYGAVSILNKLNCVDYLVFGSECGNIDKLKECAKASIDNDEMILVKMKEGLTYAKARACILEDYGDIVSSPNNVLGIEYIKSIMQLNSSITPCTFMREGQGYDESEVTNTTYLSAKSVREAALSKNLDFVDDFIPGNVYKALLENSLVTRNMFSKELFYSCLINKNNLTDYLDVSEHLANRINNNYLESFSFDQMVDELNAKNYTSTRISRALMHILLSIKGTNNYYKEKTSEISHVKILGFRKSASDLLKEIDSNACVKLYSKTVDILDSASDFSKELIGQDLFASTLYTKVSGTNIHEYSKPVTIVNL